MKLDAAKDEIWEYFRTLGYPNLYSDSRIIDSMYYAGADDVISITCTASVQWSVASKFVKTPEANDITADLAVFDADTVSPNPLTIMSSANLIPTYQDEDLGTGDQTYVSIGPRNVGYILDKEDIRFSETLRS
jgi:hypothetical protein